LLSKAHKKAETQNLFAIVQGGLNFELRRKCAQEMVKRDTPGYAIGGLSGGEDKNIFWRIVSVCTDELPEYKPRYCMGVGYSEDLVVCSALGVDMYDCVFPTRTARFGNALTRKGSLNLKLAHNKSSFTAIDDECHCPTCSINPATQQPYFTRAHLYHLLATKETVACHLLSLHNIAYQMRLMRDIRSSILEDKFPAFVQQFMWDYYKSGGPGPQPVKESEQDNSSEETVNGYPKWIVEALQSVNVELR
jgi:queuine tRNA-ribosyltransferase